MTWLSKIIKLPNLSQITNVHTLHLPCHLLHLPPSLLYVICHRQRYRSFTQRRETSHLVMTAPTSPRLTCLTSQPWSSRHWCCTSGQESLDSQLHKTLWRKDDNTVTHTCKARQVAYVMTHHFNSHVIKSATFLLYVLHMKLFIKC